MKYIIQKTGLILGLLGVQSAFSAERIGDEHIDIIKN